MSIQREKKKGKSGENKAAKVEREIDIYRKRMEQKEWD